MRVAPSSGESGENDDRKGHITHHGNARIRKSPTSAGTTCLVTGFATPRLAKSGKFFLVFSFLCRFAEPSAARCLNSEN